MPRVRHGGTITPTRMRRRLFATLATLSLLLCAAWGALWVWSYDTFLEVSRGGQHPVHGDYQLSLGVDRGRIYRSSFRRHPYPGSGSGWLPPQWDVRRHKLIGWAGWDYGRGRRVYDAMTEDHAFGVTFGRVDTGPQTMIFASNLRVRRLHVPCLYAALLLAVPPLSLALSRARRRKPERSDGRCAACGYDLRASPERCPECGKAVQSTSPT